MKSFGVVAGKLPSLRHLKGNRPDVWSFGFVIFFFSFPKVLSLQASLVGIFFNWYGKGLCGGEGRGWPLISEYLKLVKLATGLCCSPWLHFTLLLWVSHPRKHGPELLGKRLMHPENPFDVDFRRIWIKLLR